MFAHRKCLSLQAFYLKHSSISVSSKLTGLETNLYTFDPFFYDAFLFTRKGISKWKEVVWLDMHIRYCTMQSYSW